MKLIITSLILFAACITAKAQTPFNTPLMPTPVNKTSNDIVEKLPPYYIIKTQGNDYTLDAENYHLVKKDWILKTQYIKNDDITAAYGPAAANGVTIITVNDKAHPEAYNTLRKSLIPVK